MIRLLKVLSKLTLLAFNSNSFIGFGGLSNWCDSEFESKDLSWLKQ